MTNLVNGVVEGPSNGGGLTVRLAEGGIVRNVRLINRDGGRIPKPGEACLLIRDGAKIFCLGQLEPIESQEVNSGEVVLRDIDPISGLGAGVLVSADAGVLLDAGGICALELVNGKSTLYAEHAEVCTPGLHTLAEHDGVSATYHATLRGTVDLDATDADLAYDDARATTIGSAVHLDVGASGGFIVIDVRNNGVQVMLLRVNADGTFELSVPGKVNIQLGAELVVDSTPKVNINSASDVVINAGNVYVGGEAGAEPIALAPAVQSNLQLIADILTNHQHSYIVPLIPGAAVLTTPGAPPQVVPGLQSVAATNAKAL